MKQEIYYLKNTFDGKLSSFYRVSIESVSWEIDSLPSDDLGMTLRVSLNSVFSNPPHFAEFISTSFQSGIYRRGIERNILILHNGKLAAENISLRNMALVQISNSLSSFCSESHFILKIIILHTTFYQFKFKCLCFLYEIPNFVGN